MNIYQPGPHLPPQHIDCRETISLLPLVYIAYDTTNVALGIDLDIDRCQKMPALVWYNCAVEHDMRHIDVG